LNCVGRIVLSHDFVTFLGLSFSGFCGGRYWQLITYPLIPNDFFGFLISIISIGALGPRLERTWSRREFWSFCLIITIGVGLCKFALYRQGILLGAEGIVWGLTAAWLRLFGNEVILLFGGRSILLRTLILVTLIFTALMILVRQPSAIFNFLLNLIGLAVGWIYLSIRWKRNAAIQGQPVTSNRFGSLEL
jgi:membrane associated rhomboid family serine protease